MMGFKRAMVLGTAAAALLLAGGCRDEQRSRQGSQYVPSRDEQPQGTGGAGQSGTQQRPVDVNPQPDQEGFKTVPGNQTAPNGIGADQGGSGQQRPVDVNPLPDQEGFKTVPENQTAPNGIGADPHQGQDDSRRLNPRDERDRR